MKTQRHTKTSIVAVIVCVVMLLVALVMSVAILGERDAIVPILLGAGLPIIAGVLGIAYARQRILGNAEEGESDKRG